MLKLFAKFLVATSVIVVILILLLRVADTDAQKMIAKYGSEAHKVADGVGGWIYYRDQGPRDAPTLLLIHGSNASMQTWNDVITDLKGKYRLVSYDQHGHGITGPHSGNNYSAKIKIETALRVMNAADVEKAIWVGNSMGGWLTWRAALAVPERVKAIILIDASGAQTLKKARPYMAARIAASPIGQLLAPYITPRSLVAKSLQQNYADPAKISERLIDQYWELTRFPGNRRAIKYRVNTSREPEKWQEVDRISVPTLLLWGEQDTVVPVSHALAFDEKIANSELKIYPNAGHLPMEEIPHDVARDINSWIQEQNLDKR